MSNENIITPLTPDENIEINKETPDGIYTPGDSPNNQIKEAPKHGIKSFFEKMNCLEITILVLLIIIILSIITTIIIRIIYHIIPLPSLIYFFCPLVSFICFCQTILTQNFDDNGLILSYLFLGIFWLGVDFFYYLDNYKYITNEFIANSGKYLKFGEIPILVLIICLFMFNTYKRTGKICIPIKRN